MSFTGARCTAAAVLDDLAATADDLTGEQEELAERIEAVLEQFGQRGMSPAQAARHARCNTVQARIALAYLVGRQYAHTANHRNWSDYYAGRPY